jgi:hypothetical protein
LPLGPPQRHRRPFADHHDRATTPVIVADQTNRSMEPARKTPAT